MWVPTIRRQSNQLPHKVVAGAIRCRAWRRPLVVSAIYLMASAGNAAAQSASPTNPVLAWLVPGAIGLVLGIIVMQGLGGFLTGASGGTVGRVLRLRDFLTGEAQVRLQATTNRLQLAQSQARLGFWEHDIATDRSVWTKEAFEIFGLDPQSPQTGRTYLAAISSADQGRVAQNFLSAVKSKRNEYTVEYRLRHPRLGERSIFERGIIERAGDGRAVRTYGFIQDVTDLRTIESDLRQSRERLELALAGANLGSWDWNPVTKVADYDERWAGMLGYRRDEIDQLNSAFEDRIHPDDRDVTFKAIGDHLQGRTEQYEAEFRLRTKDGGWKWIQSRGRVTERSPDGSALRMSGTHVDINERKTAELVLRQNEEWLRLLTNSIRAVIWEAEVESDRYTYVSPQIEAVTGYTPEQWIQGNLWRVRTHPDDRERVFDEYEDLVRSGLSRDLEYRLMVADGRTIWIRDLIVLATSRDGRRTARGLMIDISDAKRVAEALGESERRYRTAEQVALLSHWTAKPNANPNIDNPWITFSRTATFILGVPETELHLPIEEYIRRFVHPEDQSRVEAERNRAFSERALAPPIEYRLMRDNGTEAFILQHCQFEFDADGRMTTGFGTIQDITIRKRAEKAMLDARIEAEAANIAKTQFLANTSHELRTPLNAIIGFSDLMRNELLGPIGTPVYRQYSDDIHASGQHLLAIINDLLDLSRIESGQVNFHEEELEIDLLAASCSRLLDNRARERSITLHRRNAPSLPRVLADARLLRQALINLLANAVKFTPEGGRVMVQIDRVTDGLDISVVDTGIGMSRDEVARAVKPFVQIENWLARKYEGVGLGLSIAKAYCEVHGGSLVINSEPGQGTRATIHLPEARLVTGSRPAARAV